LAQTTDLEVAQETNVDVGVREAFAAAHAGPPVVTWAARCAARRARTIAFCAAVSVRS
jgi:hypothetical protein